MKRSVALLAVVVLAGCGGYGGKKKSEEGSTTTLAGLAASDHGTKKLSGDELSVELYDNYFEPTVIEGKPGQKVTLELKNEGKAEHNLTVATQHVDQDVEAGEKAKVTLVLPKSGELSFYCKYHKQLGMAGALRAT